MSVASIVALLLDVTGDPRLLRFDELIEITLQIGRTLRNDVDRSQYTLLDEVVEAAPADFEISVGLPDGHQGA